VLWLAMTFCGVCWNYIVWREGRWEHVGYSQDHEAVPA